MTGIDDASTCIDDAFFLIDDALTRIDDALTRIDDALTSIDDTSTCIDDTSTCIDDALTSIDDALTRIDDTLTGIDDTSNALDPLRIEKDDGRSSIDDVVSISTSPIFLRFAAVCAKGARNSSVNRLGTMARYLGPMAGSFERNPITRHARINRKRQGRTFRAGIELSGAGLIGSTRTYPWVQRDQLKSHNFHKLPFASSRTSE